MNFFDPVKLKSYLQQRGFTPKDFLGQNFLIAEEVVGQIIKAAELENSDTVLEVGPGLGVLTKGLAKSAGEVWAVEKDKKIIPILKKEIAGFANVKIVEGDILKFNLEKNIDRDYKVVANIPYYLTSFLFQYFLQTKHQPTVLILMVQKEVGERVVARPGNLSLLGISVQLVADAEILLAVPKENFWPAPKVDSVVLKITPKNKYPQIKDQKVFFRILKSASAGKRKQIHNTLSIGLGLEKEKILELLKIAEIDPKIRPQDVSIEQWISLYEAFW